MDPTSDPHLLLQLFRERDTYLFFALFVIGGLYWIAANAERDQEEYLKANPGAKAMYEAWKRDRALRQHGSRPTSIICPIHKVFADQCPPGSHDKSEEP